MIVVVMESHFSVVEVQEETKDTGKEVRKLVADFEPFLDDSREKGPERTAEHQSYLIIAFRECRVDFERNPVENYFSVLSQRPRPHPCSPLARTLAKTPRT